MTSNPLRTDCVEHTPGAPPSIEALSPVTGSEGLWLKRDDLFEIHGARGGKVRACLAYAATRPGALITASARVSPQSFCVAAVAKALGRACRVHTAWGSETSELERARTLGAQVLAHRPGYSSVIARRAIDDAAREVGALVPFGMACAEAIETTAAQTANLPREAERLVMPVGSGVSLAGVLWGLKRNARQLPILGVVVGANAEKRLDQWAPSDWREHVTLMEPGVAYARAISESINGVALDPLYEAKCARFLKAGDCLWIVGCR